MSTEEKRFGVSKEAIETFLKSKIKTVPMDGQCKLMKHNYKKGEAYHFSEIPKAYCTNALCFLEQLPPTVIRESLPKTEEPKQQTHLPLGLDYQTMFKIPLSQHTKEIRESLFKKRKELNDIFYDKSKSNEERNKARDEANPISKYLGEKEIQYPAGTGKGGGGYKPKTPEERKKNCDEFLSYLTTKKIIWQDLTHTATVIRTLGQVWGQP